MARFIVEVWALNVCLVSQMFAYEKSAKKNAEKLAREYGADFVNVWKRQNGKLYHVAQIRG